MRAMNKARRFPDDNAWARSAVRLMLVRVLLDLAAELERAAYRVGR